MEMGNPLWFAEEWWAKDVTALVLTLNDRVLNDEQRKEVIMLLLRREKRVEMTDLFQTEFSVILELWIRQCVPYFYLRT